LDYQIVEGYVYMLSNPSMPNLLKIGSTTARVSQRVRALSSQTGVPAPFTVEAFWFSRNPQRDESKIRDNLAFVRKPRTEFFEIDRQDALTRIAGLLGHTADYDASVHGELKDI
jgi:hypothetical protein